MERITQVRDIFVFCCYTGQAYVDVKQLKTTDIVVGMDGEPWIDNTRQKTDAPTRIPLLDTALEIIEKYKDHPQCCAAGVVLPVLSNQKMNVYFEGDCQPVRDFQDAYFSYCTAYICNNRDAEQ